MPIGTVGERIAEQFLTDKCYHFIERNWKCKLGEIDLIFRDKNTLIFVEVKTRNDSKLAAKNIFSNITWKKRKKLRQLAQVYLLKNFQKNTRPSYRIDVIGIIMSGNKIEALKIDHLLNAIGEDEF